MRGHHTRLCNPLPAAPVISERGRRGASCAGVL